MRVWPGQPYPLGATWTGLGVNFAIFSAHATRVELCLFDSVHATLPSACVPCRSAPTWCGTAICPMSVPANCTDTVGVPMISGGDEMSRTQLGNNNAYCQDNELSWTPWDLTPTQQEFLDFTRRLVHFRRRQPVLTRRTYFQGRSIRGASVKDIYWLDPSGREMTDEAWNAPFVRSLGVLMVGDAIDEVDERGAGRAADRSAAAHP